MQRLQQEPLVIVHAFAKNENLCMCRHTFTHMRTHKQHPHSHLTHMQRLQQAPLVVVHASAIDVVLSLDVVHLKGRVLPAGCTLTHTHKINKEQAEHLN